MVENRQNIATANALATEVIADTGITIHLTIKNLRKRADITQAQLAEDLDMSHRQIAAWELGESEPNQESLRKLAEYFGKEIDYFDLTSEKTADMAKQILFEQVAHLASSSVESLTNSDRRFLIAVVKLLQPNTLVEERVVLHEKVDDSTAIEIAQRKVKELTE